MLVERHLLLLQIASNLARLVPRGTADEQARRIIELYYSLNATKRKAVTIDYLVMAAGADVLQCLGCNSGGVEQGHGGRGVAPGFHERARRDAEGH